MSHRFYALICRILHFRLLVAAPIPSRHLILECYHPTSRLSSPYAFCTYLGTDGLSAEYNGKGSIYENCEVTERLGRLCGLYSRFRPHVQVEESLQLLQSSEQTSGASVTDTNTVSVEGNNRVREQGQTNTASVRRLVSLEGGEGFSQLCIVVDLVKVKEGSGLLLSVTTVEDGVIRLWRDWLKERSKGDQDNEEEGVLWVGSAKHVGLKLRVREQRWNRNAPILVHRDEEPAVSYDVDIEGASVFLAHRQRKYPDQDTAYRDLDSHHSAAHYHRAVHAGTREFQQRSDCWSRSPTERIKGH